MNNIKHNNTPKDIDEVLLNKIDIKAGNCSFGQYIGLKKLIRSATDEVEIVEGLFKELHNYNIKPSEYLKAVPYINEISDAMLYWQEQENALLNYEPTQEEKNAGIEQLSKNIGELATIKALAKDYSQDPDYILENWKWGKVFGILYSDLETYKYQERYRKAFEKKYR